MSAQARRVYRANTGTALGVSTKIASAAIGLWAALGYKNERVPKTRRDTDEKHALVAALLLNALLVTALLVTALGLPQRSRKTSRWCPGRVLEPFKPIAGPK